MTAREWILLTTLCIGTVVPLVVPKLSSAVTARRAIASASDSRTELSCPPASLSEVTLPETGAEQAARLPLQRLATDELLRRFGGDLDLPEDIES